MDIPELVEGVVRDCNNTEMTYTVSMRDGTSTTCTNAVGFCAGLLGIKSTFRLSVDTRVIVWRGPKDYIISTIPSDLPDPYSHAGRSITGTGIRDIAVEADPAGRDSVPTESAAQDLFDGEFEMGFLNAGFLRFLAYMTSIGGSERSQIQFHMTRELVRVISGNFEHFSAFGDEVIMDDGRVSIEINGTHRHHERMGLLKEGDPLEMPADDFDGENFDPKRTGRWRYTKFIGFLGDMMNEWFTDPSETVGAMASDAYRSGLSRNAVGPEGEVLIQSCSEIVLERVVRIPVPIRLKDSDDPEGVLRSEFDALDKSFLKTWDQGNGQEGHHALFRLREYARWLSQYHCLARIHQLAGKAGEFSVPSEAQTPRPEIGKHDADTRQANSGNTYWKEAFSTIRIGRDGSILLLDSYHNSYHSGPFGMILDTPMHMRFTAGGDVSFIAGGSVFVRARRFVELVADLGGILMKGKTFLRMLAEKGSLFLNSEYDPDNPYVAEGDDPEAEADSEGYGVVVTAPSSGAYLEGGKGLKIIQKDVDSTLDISSMGKTRINLIKELDAILRNGAIIETNGDIKASGRRIVATFANVIFPGAMSIARGRVAIGSLLAKAVASTGGYSGPSDRVAKNENIPAADVDTPGDFDPPARVAAAEEADIKFAGLDDDEYKHPGLLGDLPNDSRSMFQGLSQQYLSLEGPAGVSSWTLGAIESGVRVNVSRRKTFPGSQQWLTAVGMQAGPLDTPEAAAPSSFDSLNSGAGLTPATINFYALDR